MNTCCIPRRSQSYRARRICFAIKDVLRSLRGSACIAAYPRSGSHVESVERRVLLSAYTYSQIAHFGVNVTGANPRSTLVADSSGILYGTASNGGTYGYGSVFEAVRGSSAITTLASFNDANGADPFAGLTFDAFGNLYGTTYSGGAFGGGTVFEIASGSIAITTLASFDGANGLEPYAGVTIDAPGNLYGTTEFGGANNDGTVFEIARGSSAITTLASFNGTNGSVPQAGVTLDAAGDLFGTTLRGGTIYEIARSSNTITVLSSFGTSEDAEGTLLLDASGNLYGAASNNSAGLVFEIAAGSTAATTIASFNYANGDGPEGGLAMDASGDLFGTTYYGGSTGDGNVFEIASGSMAITSLASFSGTNGRGPVAGITVDTSGNLYGTTEYGGTNNTGTVFEIAKGSTAATAFASFNSVSGVAPSGGLTQDNSGNFYGTTSRGGAYNDGTVFEIANGSYANTTIASFNQTNGSTPEGALTMDQAGNLYGTTYSGGANNLGTVFEIATGSDVITTLGSFNGSTDGNFPTATLVLDPEGDLYGTTMADGSSNGTVFEIAKGSKTITTLNGFYNSSNLSAPTTGLTLDASGNLYGSAASFGANGSGAVFEIAHGTTALTTLASFSATTTGFNPCGTLMDAVGNLYGTTENGGGANNAGTVFEVANKSDAMTTLAAFNGANGAGFKGGLTLDPSGNLFGTTQAGGAFNDGTVFEIARGSAEITTLKSFSLADGGPASQLLLDSLGDLYDTSGDGGGTAFELTPNSVVTLSANDPNPSTANQPVTLTAAVSGGVPDGETVKLVDASKNNAVVATGTLSGGSATLTVPAGTLMAGTHKLVAAYGGDANFAASESAPYTQSVQVAVTGVQVNGNLPSLVGVQRSIVDSILYTFSEPVNVSGAAATMAIHSGQSGMLPTSLTWTAIDPNSDGSSTQWAVTFSGSGVVGNSIANGVYDITLNSADVSSGANPAVTVQSRPTDTFYRLFGDINGDGVVNAADNFQLKTAMATYNAAFDYNDDGVINAADNFQFKASQSYNFSNSGIMYTI